LELDQLCEQLLDRGELVGAPERGVRRQSVDEREQPTRARSVDLDAEVDLVVALQVRLDLVPAVS
jgi:hypothetical protein